MCASPFELIPELLIFPERGLLTRAAAERFVTSARDAAHARGKFTVALSGGTTPRALYQLLASDREAFRAQVDWSRAYFFWGDERAVAPDSPDSNYRMADETLLSKVPVPRENIFRVRAEKNPEVAAYEYESTLRDFFGNRLPRFDVALLGMGANGHTASLFPHNPALRETVRWCVACWAQEIKANRITLTVPVFNNAAQVLFLVTGRDKAETLREVLRESADPERLPAQLIQPRDGKLVWLVDQDAASALERESM